MTEETKQEIMVPEKQTVAVVPQNDVLAFIPRSLPEVAQLADAVMRADMVPDSYKVASTIEGKADAGTKAKLMIGILKGLEVGLGPMTALSTIAVINNRPSIWGDGSVALIQQSGKLERMAVEEFGTVPAPTDEIGKWAPDYGIRVVMHRRNQSEPYIGTFTIADAKRANLWMNQKKLPWIQYPKRMLKWRAYSIAAREGFADCLMGLSIAEEMRDMPEESSAPVPTTFLTDAADATDELAADIEVKIAALGTFLGPLPGLAEYSVQIENQLTEANRPELLDRWMKAVEATHKRIKETEE